MLIIPIFIPHAGCPHDCCFCDQKKISGQKNPPDEAEVIEIVESYLDITSNYENVQIAFFGGSFTAIPKEMQENYLKTVAPYIESGAVSSVRLSTRPDCIDDDVLMFLRKYNVRTIELGAQSMDDDVLLASGRGHTAADTVKSSELIRAYGFELGLQTMTGLPGASYMSDIATCKKIIELKPDIVRIYPTVVLRDTFLHKMYEKGTYLPPTLEKTVALCAELMLKYKENNIKVIRMGLQASDGVSMDGEIVAGPYHPAFGQLVKSHIAYNRLVKMALERKSNDDSKLFTAYVPKEELSDYIGQKKCNVERLKKQFGYQKVIIKSIN